MQTEIERLVKQLSELQVQQTIIIERIRELESTNGYIRSTALEINENKNAIADNEDKPGNYCYDRYNKIIKDNDRVYLITKGKYKERVGKVTGIDCTTKWIAIELDSGQTTSRKSHNTKVL